MYDEAPFLRANDDGSERLIRSTKRNVSAKSQAEHMVAYEMRGRVRMATSKVALGPYGADGLEAALGSSGADDIAVVAMSESDNQRNFRQVSEAGEL